MGADDTADSTMPVSVFVFVLFFDQARQTGGGDEVVESGRIGDEEGESGALCGGR